MNSLWVILAALAAGEPPANLVDFDTEVIPILSKAGCNSAACHGAAAGRGDFHLSLFGGDPAADYHAIVHDLEGRRINLVDPWTSLLIEKPTLQLEHGGEQRFAFDSPQAQTLAAWIAEGASRKVTRQATSLRVEPKELRVEKLPATASLRVMADFDDGTERDVTEQAIYVSGDDASISVTDAGELTVLRRGQQTIVVRFLSQIATVRVVAPLTEIGVAAGSLPRQNWIDDEINASLASLGLPPSPPAGDEAFLRRIRLDLTGRLPAPDEVRQFLAEEGADKRAVLVDRLLASEDFADYWTYKFAKLLRIRAPGNEPEAGAAFHAWLRKCLVEGVPYDAMARTLLTAEGDSGEFGPANFHRVAAGAREEAEYVSELFLGVRLRCANCHNHPLDRWTQNDYHGLAAIFAPLDRNRVVRPLPRGEVTNPATGQPAIPRIPGERYLSAGEDHRLQLAEWLTAPENPYFAAAIVNRLWAAMLGRGLIEATDDLATNPATHPQLLSRLADDFVASGYDLRHTLRLIATSAAYARSSRTTGENAADDRFYSHALTRPLEPEVLLDAICDVTGAPEDFGRAIELVDPQTPSEALDILGRCSREASCEGAPVASGVAAKLHLLNGPLVNHKLDALVFWAVHGGKPTDAIVVEYYVLALGRDPTADEADFWLHELATEDVSELRRRWEDFAWSLLNCREFTTNH